MIYDLLVVVAVVISVLSQFCVWDQDAIDEFLLQRWRFVNH